ncbi:site-specific integrase [Massilia violaceinigra]|uniref:Site-specific integrase n=1 Tax=Massilia violaceinigra TaxID=2045208 RepID=A0ABY4A4Y0_9BURK|nr:site-specific integrase [Massilia violaceinigra]UOD28739.1 site-specific integrase [Massilia violaceinigra]
MAAPKKVDGRWQHRVMVKGKRTSGTFDTKAAALAWEAEQRTAVAGGGGGAITQTCADAFDQYERDVSRRKKGHVWEKRRLAAFSKSPLGAVLMCEVDSTHVAKWRDWRLTVPVDGRRLPQGSTVQREMNLLSNVFTIARKEWKWIAASPTTDVKRPKENKARFRRISEDEIKQMCDALGWRNAPPTTKMQSVAAVFLFAIETAMRLGEICKLTKGSVTGRVAKVLGSKNGEDRDVPLSPRAMELWSWNPEGFGVCATTLDALFRKARKDRTTITNMTFHDSRHEAITRLAKKLHVLDLARMVGHKDIRKLMIYYNESAEDIAAKL